MLQTTGRRSPENSSITQAALAACGVAAPFGTFAIAISGIAQDIKVILLVALSVLYASICVWALFRLKRHGLSDEAGNFNHRSAQLSDLEQKLIALDDAREFLGSSLKPADLFRLVAGRVNEIVPFTSCLLLVKDVDGATLNCVHAFGANAKHFESLSLSADHSLAGLSFYSGEIEATLELKEELESYPQGLLDGVGSSAALPLKVDDETFASLQLFFPTESSIDGVALDKLHAIAERISPLFLSSMAYERSLSNSLTDPLTKLPNERAFQMVLENQLAESLRFRDERPLTVLVVDIRNFEEINRSHGHAVGDRALSFAAEKISSQLRKMDFLARSMNDEFFIVLPKATERVTIEITGRIQSTLSTTPLILNDDEHLKLWLNFGWATFWRDGETAQQLVNGALSRKQQAKSEEPDVAAFLPKEYVN